MPPRAGQDSFAVFGKYDPIASDQNSPYAHPELGDTAAWKALLLPLYRKFSLARVDQLDRILEKYRGNEVTLFKAFRHKYFSRGRGAIPNNTLPARTCRLCGRDGHWGNECPDRLDLSRAQVFVRLRRGQKRRLEVKVEPKSEEEDQFEEQGRDPTPAPRWTLRPPPWKRAGGPRVVLTPPWRSSSSSVALKPRAQQDVGIRDRSPRFARDWNPRHFRRS